MEAVILGNSFISLLYLASNTMNKTLYHAFLLIIIFSMPLATHRIAQLIPNREKWRIQMPKYLKLCCNRQAIHLVYLLLMHNSTVRNEIIVTYQMICSPCAKCQLQRNIWIQDLSGQLIFYLHQEPNFKRTFSMKRSLLPLYIPTLKDTSPLLDPLNKAFKKIGMLSNFHQYKYLIKSTFHQLTSMAQAGILAFSSFLLTAVPEILENSTIRGMSSH